MEYGNYDHNQQVGGVNGRPMLLTMGESYAILRAK